MPRISIALATLFALGLAPLAHADEVTVFAAASLKDALDGVIESYAATTEDTVIVSYGGSSALAEQIKAGAPADIFISASSDWMDDIAAAGAVVEGTRSDLLGNTLVVIGHGVQAASDDIAAILGTLPEDGHLAMALVDSVPAGVYGKAALTNLGLWDGIAPRVVQAENVRSALALVSSGEAGLGIVYATDAGVDDHVSVVATFPTGSHAPIVYPAALLTDAPATEAAATFLDYLSGAEASKVFTEFGFVPLTE